MVVLLFLPKIPILRDYLRGLKWRNKKDTKKEKIMREFISLNGISKVKAERLYKKGFDSLDKLKTASVEDLIKVDGIGKILAKDIKKQIEKKRKLKAS